MGQKALGVLLPMNAFRPTPAPCNRKRFRNTVRKSLFAALTVAAAASPVAPVLNQTALAQTATLTAPGTNISHSITANFKIGTTDQTAVSTAVTYKVDRYINFKVVAMTDITQLNRTAQPGATKVPIAFGVSNLSNDTIDINLEALQYATGGNAGATNTDSFNVDNVTIYVDKNNDRILTEATDPIQTYIDEIAPGQTRYFWVVADIPSTVTNKQSAGIEVVSTALNGGTANVKGAAIQEVNNGGLTGVDTIFGEEATSNSVAYNGIYTTVDYYEASAAALVYTWKSTVLSDITGSSNPKLIPGASVEFCLTVSNGASAAKAAGVKISNTFPADLTFSTAYGVKAGGSTAGSTECSVTNATNGTIEVDAKGQVTKILGNLGDIDPGVTKSFIFRAEVK